MRWTRRAAIIVAVCLLAGPRVEAGIYSTDPIEQLIPGPLSLPQFQAMLGRYQAATNTKAPLHHQYLAHAQELEARERGPFGLSTDERVSLSFVYLRLGQAEKAAQVLKPVEGERNFMVHANLATAHQISNELERAADYQERALKEWPSTWPGMTQAQLSWFYRVEKYYQTLLRARLRESRVAPGKPPEAPDELFPGVRFIGSDNQYQPGAIDPLQYARLPTDALPVMQQLVLWLPNDERLTWLLAEVLNANGFVEDGPGGSYQGAWRVLYGLSDRGYSPRELNQHRQILKEALPVLKAWNQQMLVNDDYWKLLWAVSPRGGAAPGSFPIASEAGWALGLAFVRVQRPRDEDVSPPPPAPTRPPATDAWLPPSGRLVVVSFLAGVALTLLAGMQVREMGRRRRENAAARGDQM